MNRAERRHRTFKIHARRECVLSCVHKYVDPILLETPALCSCWMCGNPRKYNRGKTKLTRQELKSLDYNGFDLVF